MRMFEYDQIHVLRYANMNNRVFQLCIDMRICECVHGCANIQKPEYVTFLQQCGRWATGPNLPLFAKHMFIGFVSGFENGPSGVCGEKFL
jgi:hypothetical protein